MNLSLNRISLAALVAAVAGTAILLLCTPGLRDAPRSGSDWQFVCIVAFFSFGICWISLVLAVLLLRKLQVPAWIWHPIPATVLGVLSGLIVGWPLLAALYPFPAWIGSAYGGIAGLAASVLSTPTTQDA